MFYRAQSIILFRYPFYSHVGLSVSSEPNIVEDIIESYWTDSTDGIEMEALIVVKSSQLAIKDGIEMLLLVLNYSVKVEAGWRDLNLVFLPRLNNSLLKENLNFFLTNMNSNWLWFLWVSNRFCFTWYFHYTHSDTNNCIVYFYL